MAALVICSHACGSDRSVNVSVVCNEFSIVVFRPPAYLAAGPAFTHPSRPFESPQPQSRQRRLAGGALRSWAARLLAHNPASLFCLEHCKGALGTGLDADITVLVPGPHEYDPAASGHNAARWSPYAGMMLPHRVQATYLRGKLVFDGTAVHASPGAGRVLRPVAMTVPISGI